MIPLPMDLICVCWREGWCWQSKCELKHCWKSGSNIITNWIHQPTATYTSEPFNKQNSITIPHFHNGIATSHRQSQLPNRIPSISRDQLPLLLDVYTFVTSVGMCLFGLAFAYRLKNFFGDAAFVAFAACGGGEGHWGEEVLVRHGVQFECETRRFTSLEHDRFIYSL